MAVDLKTGVSKWHYQFVHHGIWDMDISSPPILADITVNGRTIKVVAQPTKQAWLYVFDRVTGQPVWPIEERPVPKGDVPGEWYAPTQPFVTKPPAFDRQGVSLDDLIDFTPELKAEAVKLAARHRLGPIFTPPSVSKAEGPLGTLMPANLAGANWAGGSLRSRDPSAVCPLLDADYVPWSGSRRSQERLRLRSRHRDGGDGGGRGGGGLGGLTLQGLALVKPPYGRITAFDLDKGDIVWQIAHGETPDNVRTHPALKGQAIPRTGQRGVVGTLVTRSLVIAGEPQFTTINNARGAMLRAYDKSPAPRSAPSDAGPADRGADDLHAERQAIHRRRDRRRRFSRGAARLQIAGMTPQTIHVRRSDEDAVRCYSGSHYRRRHHGGGRPVPVGAPAGHQGRVRAMADGALELGPVGKR